MREVYSAEDIEDLLAEFNSPKNRLVVFKPFVRYFGDLNTAIILSEIFTWSHHYRNRNLPGMGCGWFYRQYEPSCKHDQNQTSIHSSSNDEREEKTTGGFEGKTWIERVGLREDVVRKIVKSLVKDGYIQTAIRKANGAPTCHYKFARGKLLELMDTLKEQEWKPVKSRNCYPEKSGMETCEKQDSLTEETTNNTKEKTAEEIRLLLSGTPLFKISVKELKTFIQRHNIQTVIAGADIAAETWRRERKDIRNPGGYLQTLCESHVVPEWYEPLEVRRVRMAKATERKLADTMKQNEKNTSEEKEVRARESNWLSLSDKERENIRAEVITSSPLFLNLPDVAIEAIAKLTAWEQCTQMTTNPEINLEHDYISS